MYELLIIAIYTVLILLFVPLNKIGKAQDYARNKYKQLRKKIEE